MTDTQDHLHAAKDLLAGIARRHQYLASGDRTHDDHADDATEALAHAVVALVELLPGLAYSLSGQG